MLSDARMPTGPALSPPSLPSPTPVPLLAFAATPHGGTILLRAGDGDGSAHRRLAVCDVQGRIVDWVTLDGDGRARWTPHTRGVVFVLDPQRRLAARRLTLKGKSF